MNNGNSDEGEDSATVVETATEPESETETNVTPSSPQTMKGAITTSLGHANQFHHWQIFLMEKGSGRGSLGEISANGSFTLNHIDRSQKHSLVLFNSDYQLAAVLSRKVSESSGLLQYFSTALPDFPYLIYNGPTLEFGDTQDIEFDTHTITDTDTNSVPDGMDTIWQLNDPSTTTDIAFDRDSDGIDDRIDRDDDGDGLIDVLDDDSDGDNIEDRINKTHDQYLSKGVFFNAIVIERLDLASNQTEYYLHWVVKLQKDAAVSSVTLQAPLSVIENAQSINISGQQENSWDGELYDDGQHFDMAEGDAVYSIRVKITEDQLPRRYQVYFIRLTSSGNNGEDQHVYYAGNFPDLTPQPLQVAYADGVVTKSGTPLGTGNSYVWSVLVKNSNADIVYVSPAVPSATDTFTLPITHLPRESGMSLQIIATSPQRVLSFPAYKISSPLLTLDLSNL